MQGLALQNRMTGFVLARDVLSSFIISFTAQGSAAFMLKVAAAAASAA